MQISQVESWRAAAEKALPGFLFHYIEGAANEEETARLNRVDLRAILLRQRVLKDVSEIDLSTALFGQPLDLPLLLGPVGLAGMYARRGEAQAAAAAAARGIPMCLSTMSVCPLSEVAAASAQPLWFQLYVMRDRGVASALMAEARACGCTTLVLTVDMPAPGARHRDARSGLSGRHGPLKRFAQALTRPRWALDVGLLGRPHALGNLRSALGSRSGLEDFMGWIANNFDPTVTWRDLDWVREQWDGPLVVKGILDVEDARQAVALGVDGVVVSNHGGRQLDGAMSTARALPAIRQALGNGPKVLVDGGVRSGLDVLRMLALGADAVMLGRAWAYALAAGGGPAVEQLISQMAAELLTGMRLTGCTRVADIDGSILARSAEPQAALAPIREPLFS